MGPIRRRDFVGALVAAVAASPVLARPRRQPPPILSIERLSPDTRLIGGAGGNVLATRSAEGLIVVDGGLADHRDSVLEVLSRELGGEIAWLFNTHWHREQTGLNERVGQRGRVICAHENTRLWLATEFYVDWQDRTYGPLPAPALPNRRFHDGVHEATVGGRRLRYGRLPNAHTDGDLFVQLLDEDLLAVGGALTPGSYPVMDYATGGWLGGLVDASRRMLELAGPGTRLIAASGGLLGREVAEAQLELATTMRERLAAQMKLGKSPQDMLDEGITRDFDARYGDPAFFVRSGYRGLWGHIRELGIS